MGLLRRFAGLIKPFDTAVIGSCLLLLVLSFPTAAAAAVDGPNAFDGNQSLGLNTGVQQQIDQNNNVGGLDSSGSNLNTGTGVGTTQSNNTSLLGQGVNGNNAATSLSGGQSTGVDALQQTCGVQVQNQQNGQLQIFSIGVKCFENIVNGLAESTISKISGYLSNAVYILLVLWLIIYGARVSLGMVSGEQVKKEFMVNAFKIAFVAWLVFSLGLIDIYTLVLQGYYSMINIVLSGASFGDTLTDCKTSTYSNGGTDAIWSTMDCMLSDFVGWQKQNGYGATYKNVPYFFGIMFSKMLPANGFLIGGILFSALWALLSGFFRMAFVYILSLVALILLFAISPLIIPMMLFKYTYKYFDSWVKLVVSMILQPVILFAFFSFVANMIASTIADMEKIFKQVQLAFQNSGVNITGDNHDIHQTIGEVGNAISTIDPKILVAGVTTLIIAYLLISFINYVSQMALELAGMPGAPSLGGLSSDMFNKGL